MGIRRAGGTISDGNKVHKGYHKQWDEGLAWRDGYWNSQSVLNNPSVACASPVFVAFRGRRCGRNACYQLMGRSAQLGVYTNGIANLMLEVKN